ncbi:MAG TPA: type ISP restriction/modification enzyme [Candidatus Paceibacterota bacterium]|nr:type ISP restriction/modification enzyme [Candidatus Paceibacterota bacterium]
MSPHNTYLSSILRTRTATVSAGMKDLEHQHRPSLKVFLEAILPGVQAVNEAGKVEFGAPDFALIKGGFPIGYVETKRLGENLNDIAKGEQLKRYFGYANLILTNYLEFRFYKHGEAYCDPITIADLATLTPDKDSCTLLETTTRAFLEDAAEPVRRASRLAEIMGENGKRLRANLLRFLKTDSPKNKPLLDIYEAFKSQLIHDLKLEEFTDMYAQTLVYGLFVARYHDESPRDFTRAEARELIPHSNPLLRRFFDHIAGADFDDRLKPIVDDLCKVFGSTDVRALMQQIYKQDLWGAEHAAPDPVIHFYEDFLKAYDPVERKKLGAYYTPPAVVHFIVRSVDSILKRDFDLPQGLADTKKISVTRTVQGRKVKDSIHQVQVLDPATGTGTFLNETIRIIRSTFAGQEGRFSGYVSEDLLPRLHGFELMMAPYTIAHLKLAATLRESGAKDFRERIGVYLTNSLEKVDRPDDSLFGMLGLAQSISEESRAAARIKNDTPIMVVIGNPPYSVSSNNPSIVVGTDGKKRKTWIGELIDDYKKDLGERKINLDDDYIKFIRLAEYFIEKNGAGVVGMITNHSFIDGVTHRKMRKHLLETFDEIYVLDLHGNSLRAERAPNGGDDQNVFEIQQGVSISLFIKRGGPKKKLGAVYHAELWGKRDEKFDALNALSIEDGIWQKVKYSEPNYFFVPKDFAGDAEYQQGFSIKELFLTNNTGIQTKRDALSVRFDKGDFEQIREDFLSLPEKELRTKYELRADGRDWTVSAAKRDLTEHEAGIVPILYRPFDIRWTLYTGTTKGFHAYPRHDTSRHMLNGENLALITLRLNGEGERFVALVSNTIVEKGSLASGNYSFFPLYQYDESGQRHASLKSEIVRQIASSAGCEPSPEEIFDYVYAVLHSSNYREKYKEFLKIDFPRVPYPKDRAQFGALAALGKQLRELHLLESPAVRTPITTYPEGGTNRVGKIKRKGDSVYINETQYFGNVPEVVWTFYIGGYQPAQKWLKDRVGRTLTSADIEHYQKVIVALSETRSIMGEIDTAMK